MISLKTVFTKNTGFRLLLLFLLLIAACTHTKKDSGQFVFRYNESGGINSLDPAFSRDKSSIWATSQLFNGLLQMDDSLRVVPCIARAYEVDESATLYTFFLRRDVAFHKDICFGKDSTRNVVAEDFVYSFYRLLDPALASPGRWTLDMTDSIWAENDSILQIRLKAAFIPFASVLTMKYCSVVPKEAVEYYGSSFGLHPVGTGPFCFKVWYPGEKLVLRKNNHYFEKDGNNTPLPYADGVAITFITDPQAAFLEFLKGNIDFISGLDAGYKDEILTKDGALKERYIKDFILDKQAFLNTEYLIFNVDSAQKSLPIQDVRLRQAINFGINRENMMQFLRNNIGKPANGGIVPVGIPGNISGLGYTYDPERAKKLILDVQNDHGKIPPLTLTTVANYRDLCEFIQSELAKCGLVIKVDVVPAANLRELKSQGALSFYRASWIADYPDAENYLSLFYGPNRSPAGPNYSRFYHPQYDVWYRRISTLTHAEERETLYRSMDSLIVYEAPIVPLYYDELVRMYPVQIRGLKSNAMNGLDLRYVYRTSGEKVK